MADLPDAPPTPAPPTGPARAGSGPPGGPRASGAAIAVAAAVAAAAGTGSGLLVPGADLDDGTTPAVRGAGLAVAVLAVAALASPAGRRACRGWAVPGVVLAGAALLTALAVLTLPHSAATVSRSGDDAPPPRPPARLDPSGPTTLPPTTLPTEGPGTDGDDGPVPELLLVAGVALGALALVLWSQRRLPQWPWRPGGDSPVRAAAPPVDADAAVESLEASLEAARRPGAPAEAIAGAYARLLDALAEAGGGRHEHEAPHEHLHRVLGPLGVRPAPLHRLADLFVLARFSTHAVTHAHRGEAVAALEAGLADLGAAPRAGARRGGP